MTNTESKPRFRSWTKRERIEFTGQGARTRRDSTFEHKCYLCNKPIPMGACYLKGTIQARAYRSMRDIGDTHATVRICASCLFPVSK